MKVRSMGLIVLMVIGGFTSGYELGQQHPSIEQAFQSAVMNINVGLTVKAYHADGTLFAVRDLPHDLILDNFNSWTRAVFRNAGVGPNFNTWPNGAGSCSIQSPFSICGIFMEIGTSGTAPTRGDTALGSIYTPGGGSAAIIDTARNPTVTTYALPAICNHGATDTVTGISGSQAITSSVTIQEAGLFSKGYAAAGGTMLFHDTFVGINVINGDTVTISYEIDLNNSGLNDNFCRFIAGGMTGNLAGGGASNVTITSTSGSTLVVDLWCNAGSAVGTDVPNKATAHSTSCGTPPSTEPMAIGTGSSAFTTSSLALTTMVGSYTQVASASYVSPTNYWTTTFTVGSSNTIGEAGMFLTISGVNYMFFALTFTGQSETANTPFGVTIRMSD